MRAADVELIIDTRKLQPPPQNAEELISLWEQTQSVIAGKIVSSGDCRPVEFPGRGQLDFIVIRTSSPNVTVSEKTTFAVHSVLERSRTKHRCRLCAAAGEYADGPFFCKECSRGDAQAGVCERHVRILEGGLRRGAYIASTCAEHSPRCSHCQQAAVFWCLGPICKGNQAWCNAERKTHRNNQDNPYCPACYELVYPQCVQANCLEPGTSQCEHIDSASGKPCGRRLCNRHVGRWQVYGYERIGLARCSEHRRIMQSADADVVWQIVAGTTLRRSERGGTSMRLRGQQQTYPLPTLGSIKNVLLKARKQFYSESMAMQLYEGLRFQLRNASHRSPLQAKMLELLDRSAPIWLSGVVKAEARKEKGLSYLEKLKATLSAAGLYEMASTVEMTDFIPESTKDGRSACLYIRLPEEYRGRFIGRDGIRKREFSQRVGCDIRFEKGQ